jgi:hypothetical protein
MPLLPPVTSAIRFLSAINSPPQWSREPAQVEIHINGHYEYRYAAVTSGQKFISRLRTSGLQIAFRRGSLTEPQSSQSVDFPKRMAELASRP